MPDLQHFRVSHCTLLVTLDIMCVCSVSFIHLKYNDCVSKHFLIIRHSHPIDLLFERLLKPGFEVLCEVFLNFKLIRSHFIGT